MPKVLRAAANRAAARRGLTIGDWLSEVIAAHAGVAPADDAGPRALTYVGAPATEEVRPGAPDDYVQAIEVVAVWEDAPFEPRGRTSPWGSHGPERDYGRIIEDLQRRLHEVEARRRPSPLGRIFRRRL